MEFGYQKGDVCGRDGCTGIIKEREVNGCCSCHLSAPCSYSTTPRGYCPECGWDSADDELLASRSASVSSFFPRDYLSREERFARLADGEFGYVVWATFGLSYELPQKVMTVREAKGASHAGVCSTERSMIAPAYAKNFISDFIFGVTKEEFTLGGSLFDGIV